MMKHLIIIWLTLILMGCTPTVVSAPERITSTNVAEAFAEGGLEVGDYFEMTDSDYGLAPKLANNGTKIKTEKGSGRILVFDNATDLETTQQFYADLGSPGTMLYSHVYRNDLMLLQLNGSLEQDIADRYNKIFQGLGVP